MTMTEEEWAGKQRPVAPRGMFRVLGEDAFEQPPIDNDYWIGDYPTLAQARSVADSKRGPMNPVRVYDDTGKLVYCAGEDGYRKDVIMETNNKLAEKLNPRVRGFSPKLAALVGAIIGFDYGVRDSKGAQLGRLSITSDGSIIAASDANDPGAIIAEIGELDRNLKLLLDEAKLTKEEQAEFNRLYKLNVLDLRMKPG